MGDSRHCVVIRDVVFETRLQKSLFEHDLRLRCYPRKKGKEQYIILQPESNN